MADNGRDADPAVLPADGAVTEIPEHEPTVRLDRIIINGDPTLPTAFGRYRVLERIGVGGFASVYSAVDPDLQSQVAVKVLAENHSADTEIRRRFVAEARVARRLASDRLINVFDLGETGDGRPFVVMELADRGTLGMRVGEIGRPGDAGLIRLIEELGACLEAIHRKGVVHRDIKPSNLLLRSVGGHRPTGPPAALIGPDEHLVLADFGLARDISAGASGLTVGGGTAGYMAPEQADPSGRADHRADLYAATVVLAELTTLRHPERLDLATASLAPAVLAALRSGLAIDRDDRPADAGAWQALMLDAYRSGSAPSGTAADASEAPTVVNRTRIQVPARYDDPEAYTPIPGDDAAGSPPLGSVPVADGHRPGADEVPPPPPPTIAAPPGFHRPPPGGSGAQVPPAPVTADTVRAWIAATKAVGAPIDPGATGPTTRVDPDDAGATGPTTRVDPDDAGATGPTTRVDPIDPGATGPTTRVDPDGAGATIRVDPGRATDPLRTVAVPEAQGGTTDGPTRSAGGTASSGGDRTVPASSSGPTVAVPDPDQLAEHAETRVMRQARPVTGPDGSKTELLSPFGDGSRTEILPAALRPDEPLPRATPPAQPASPPRPGRNERQATPAPPRTERQRPGPVAAPPPVTPTPSAPTPGPAPSPDRSAAPPRSAPPPVAAPPFRHAPPPATYQPLHGAPPPVAAPPPVMAAAPGIQAPPPRMDQLVIPAPPGPAPVAPPRSAPPPAAPDRQHPPSRRQAREWEKQERRDREERARQERRDRKERARQERRARRRRRWRRIANFFIGLIRGTLAAGLAVVATTLVLANRSGVRPEDLGPATAGPIAMAGFTAFVLGILIFPFPRYIRSRNRS